MKQGTKTQKLIGAEIIKETEKAYRLEIEIDTAKGRRGWSIWMPKSQMTLIDGAIEAATWIIGKKEDDIEEYTGSWATILTA